MEDFLQKQWKSYLFKKFKTTAKVFDSIKPSIKKTPNQYRKEMNSKLSRYTPLEKTKNKDAIKGRVMRGEYSTGYKMSTNTDSEYDFLEDMNPSYSWVKDETYNNPSLVRQLDVESIEEISNESIDINDQQEQSDEVHKLNKIPEVELSLYSDESVTNVSIQSIESIAQSERKLNINEEKTEENGFSGATGGKRIQNRDWIKESESSKIVK